MDIMDIAIAKALSGGGGSGGGGDICTVNVEATFDEGTGGFVIDTIDKTFAEVVEAYNNGAFLIAKATIDGDQVEYLLIPTDIDTTNSEASIGISFIKISPSFADGSIVELMAFHLVMLPNGTNTFEFASVPFA